MQHPSLHRWDVCWGHGMQQQLAQNDRLGGRVAAQALGPTAPSDDSVRVMRRSVLPAVFPACQKVSEFLVLVQARWYPVN